MGTNSVQSMDVLEQGIGMFRDLHQRNGAWQTGDDTSDIRAGQLEDQARGDARDIRRKATAEAESLREAREKARARHHTGWGGSNLTMSGSKQLIREAVRTRDEQDEEDVLFEGEMGARAELRDARNRADRIRISSGGKPRRSTLSLGSKIYQTRS